MNRELFLEKDKEFIKFASKMEFSPKNYQIYLAKVKEMTKLVSEFQVAVDEAVIDTIKIDEEMEVKIKFYKTIWELQQGINELLKKNYKKSQQLPHYFQLIQFIIKYYESVSNSFEKLKKYQEASKVVNGWRKNQESINKFYQALYETDEDILKEELPKEKTEGQTEEEYQKYIFAFYHVPDLNKEEQMEDPMDLIDEEALDEWINSVTLSEELEQKEIKIAPEEYEVKVEEHPNSIEEITFEEPKEETSEIEDPHVDIENAELENKKAAVRDYLNQLYAAMDYYSKIKKEVMVILQNNEKIPEELLQLYQQERENQNFYTEEIQRIASLSSREIEEHTLEELQIKAEPLDFKKEIKDEKKLVSEPKEERIEEEFKEPQRKKEKQVSEVSLIGNLHRAIKEYEEFTNNQVSINIKQRKEKQKGSIFKIIQKAPEKIKNTYHKYKKQLVMGAIGGLAIGMGLLGVSTYKNLLKKYEPKVNAYSIENQALNDFPTEEKEVQIVSNEVEKSQLEKRAVLDSNFIKNDIELPFSIGKDTFTLKNNTDVYTDEYLGYDGNPTGRTPMFTSDMLRTIEEAIVKNQDNSIRRCYNDEELRDALESYSIVIGVYSFDGFYRINEIHLSEERGIHR